MYFIFTMKLGITTSLELFKNIYRKLHTSNLGKKPPWNVLFFGADEFSIYSLKSLYNEYNKGTILKKLEVVTTVKGKPNPVRKYAEEHKLFVHSWPVEVPKDTFDVGLVVSFGHLIPESVINKFPLGMVNVHASLLPRWRGAAPVIYALAYGDTESGVTIMRIRPKHFDIGEVLMQAKLPISNQMKMPDLYEKLGDLGARCLLDCLKNLPEKLMNAKTQSNEGVTLAPKVTPEFSVVHWEKMTSTEIYNRERAVAGLLHLTSSWNGLPVKLVGITDCGSCNLFLNSDDDKLSKPGFVKYDKKRKALIVLCANNTWVSVDKVGVFGRKIMSAMDFNNGFIKKEPVDRRFWLGTT